MKRCIVCGNIGSDDSVACDVCGNPFIDMGEASEEGGDSEEAADEMEEQLKEVWAKVQNDEPTVPVEIVMPGVSATSESSLTGNGAVPESARLELKRDRSTKSELELKLKMSWEDPELLKTKIPEPEVIELPESDMFSEPKVEQAEGAGVKEDSPVKPVPSVGEEASVMSAPPVREEPPVMLVPPVRQEPPAVSPVKPEPSVEPVPPVKQGPSVEPVSPVQQRPSAEPVSPVQQRPSAEPVSPVKPEPSAEPVPPVQQRPSAEPVPPVKKESPAAAVPSAREEASVRKTSPVRKESSARNGVHEQILEDTASSGTTAADQSAQRTVRTRRSRSGPQIYGQDTMGGYDGAQGVIRRDVQGGRSANGARGETARGNGAQRDSAARGAETQRGDAVYGTRTQGGSAAGRTGTRRSEASRGDRPQSDTSVSGSGTQRDIAARGTGTRRDIAARGDAVQYRQTPDQGGRQSRRSESSAAASKGSQQQIRPENVQQGRTVNSRGAAAAASGAAMQSQRGGAQPYAQSPQGGRMPVQHSSKTAGKAREVMEAARDAVASPLLMLVALLHTVYFVSSVAAIFLRELSYSQMAKLLTLVSLPSQVSGYVSMFQSAMTQLDQGALAINLIIRIPDLLFCLGLWLICITARTSKGRMPGVGFLLMKVDILLNMITACLVLLVVLVVSVTLVIASRSAGTQSLIAAVGTLILVIVVTMAVIMYYFCYLATIKTVQVNARTGEQYGKVSTYVALAHIVLAFTGIINILSGIVNAELTGITGGVGGIGWMLLFGVWIFRYRSTLGEYEE